MHASYPVNYCYRVDYDGDDKTPHASGKSYPSVVSNVYGRGKAMAMWKFDLSAGAIKPLQLTLRAPLSTGAYTVGTALAVVRNNVSQPYASYSQSFSVMDSLTPAKAAYQKLCDINVPLLESVTWLSTKVKLGPVAAQAHAGLAA